MSYLIHFRKWWPSLISHFLFSNLIFKALDAKKDKTIATNQIWIRNKHVRGIFAKKYRFID